MIHDQNDSENEGGFTSAIDEVLAGVNTVSCRTRKKLHRSERKSKSSSHDPLRERPSSRSNPASHHQSMDMDEGHHVALFKSYHWTCVLLRVGMVSGWHQ